jgi:hypothetical protein
MAARGPGNLPAALKLNAGSGVAAATPAEVRRQSLRKLPP